MSHHITASISDIMSSPYGDLPTLAASTIKPFTVRLPAADLEELRTLLKSSRIGPPTYESGLQDRKYGITHDWLVDAKDQWLNNFDWQVAPLLFGVSANDFHQGSA